MFAELFDAAAALLDRLTDEVEDRVDKLLIYAEETGLIEAALHLFE